MLGAGDAPEPAGEVVIDVEFANITFVETQVRAGRAPVPGPAADDPGQRRRRHVGRPPRDRLAGRLGRLRGARGRRRASSTSRTSWRSTTPSRCSPTAARRRCSPTPPRSQPGERVLVLAAAGGVGTLLVQLARRARAPPSSARPARDAKRELVGVARRRRDRRLRGLSGGPFDVVFDGVGGRSPARRSRGWSRAGGCSRTGSLQRRLGGHQRGGGRGARRHARAARAAGRAQHTERALAAGLTPVIGQRFPLEAPPRRTRRWSPRDDRQDAAARRRSEPQPQSDPGVGVGCVKPCLQTALIVIDMLNTYDHEDADRLAECVREKLPADRRSPRRGERRARTSLLIYVNDNHDEWDAGRESWWSARSPGERPDLVEPIAPAATRRRSSPKGRHSIFYQTAVDHLLRVEDVKRVVLAGQVTEQCILYSALDAYLRGYEVVVPPRRGRPHPRRARRRRADDDGAQHARRARRRRRRRYSRSS